MDYLATIQLGDPNGKFEGMSEFTDKFVPKKIEAADYDKQKALKKELLTSRIDLGQENTNYGTTYRTEHDEKGYCKDSGKSEEIKKDLRSTHYRLGYNEVT